MKQEISIYSNNRSLPLEKPLIIKELSFITKKYECKPKVYSFIYVPCIQRDSLQRFVNLYKCADSKRN